MSGVIPPFLVCVVLVTYRAVAGKDTIKPPLSGAPLPSTYVATAATYGVLGVMDHVTSQSNNLAGLLGWGFDLAIFLNLFSRPKAGAAPAAALKAQSTQSALATTAALGAPGTG